MESRGRRDSQSDPVRAQLDGWVGVGLLLSVAVLASCSPDDRPANPSKTSAVSPAADAYSNVLTEDYVGPDICGRCHEQNHASWKLHPHSRMNQLAGRDSVLGDFSGATLAYADGEAVFRRQGEQYLMEYRKEGKSVRTFRVTRTIGWRYLQEYVGVQIRGPEPKDDLLYKEETRLKFGYVLKDKRWLPQSYLDSPNDGSEYQEDGRPRYDPFDPEKTPFNTRCIHCHNTYPYELRLYTDDRLQGFPPAPSRLIESLLQDRPAFRDQQHNPTLPTRSLVTVGISCESCHLGGREHARDPKKPPRFVPSHSDLAGWTPDHLNARTNPAIVNALCRQCHFSGASSWADGSSVLNSMESIEQDRGACVSRLRCIDCHNPHVRGPDAGASDRPEAVAACLRCHERFKSPEAARSHGGHAPGQASCLDCHMPRIVHGFDTINRTHRISSPTQPGILESGMPNACNLCHLDRSLAWTRDALSKGWGKRPVLPDFLEEVFGIGHGKPAGEAWLDQPMGMLRVVAASAYARSRLAPQVLPRLLSTLEEPNAYLRMRFLQIVEQAMGRKVEEREFALTGSPDQRRRQLQALLKRSSDR
ncbi:MAG TPA: ammonia-forming cytochrome c nitrite reductase subunit c552 [Planctomycetota bacterium]|nr:ammonia-forming cytochrome c nitrite reductase subunit c552 [Planctomycetota bacterium]